MSKKITFLVFKKHLFSAFYILNILNILIVYIKLGEEHFQNNQSKNLILYKFHFDVLELNKAYVTSKYVIISSVSFILAFDIYDKYIKFI